MCHDHFTSQSVYVPGTMHILGRHVKQIAPFQPSTMFFGLILLSDHIPASSNVSLFEGKCSFLIS